MTVDVCWLVPANIPEADASQHTQRIIDCGDPIPCDSYVQHDTYQGTADQLDAIVRDGILTPGEDSHVYRDSTFHHPEENQCSPEPQPSASPTPPAEQPTASPEPTPSTSEPVTTPVESPTPTSVAPSAQPSTPSGTPLDLPDPQTEGETLPGSSPEPSVQPSSSTSPTQTIPSASPSSSDTPKPSKTSQTVTPKPSQQSAAPDLHRPNALPATGDGEDEPSNASVGAFGALVSLLVIATLASGPNPFSRKK